MTTVGLLTLLSFWATVMRAISARNTALKLMASFLGVFIDWVKEEIEESFGIIYGSEVLLYQEDVDTPIDVCCHCKEVVAGMCGVSLQSRVATVLPRALHASNHCATLRAWCGRAFPWLGQRIARALDCVALKRNPLKTNLLEGPKKKKRRLGEDFVKALVFATQEPGNAGCCENWARAVGDIAPGVAKRRAGHELVEYNTACWCDFKDVKWCVGFFDASRFW